MAKSDVGVWGNRVAQSEVYGIDANTFTSFATHSMPTGSPRLLNGSQVINHQFYTPPSNTSYTFTMYEVTDFDDIWDDKGSWASNDIAIWRSRGGPNAHSLGDIAVPGGKPTKGYVVKQHREGALRAAYDYRIVWNDKGSSADRHVTIYRPLCPPGYRHLGHIAMTGYDRKPSASDFRCVAERYTVEGKWQFVWKDSPSRADVDVSVYKAVRDGKGQGVEAMSATAKHGDIDVTAYVLNPDFVKYVVGKPVQQYILTDVKYTFDDRTKAEKEPENFARTSVDNKGDTEQTITRVVTYTIQETYSWSNIVGIEVGVEAEISAGIPFLAEKKVNSRTICCMC